jgi:hypothetical protein
MIIKMYRNRIELYRKQFCFDLKQTKSHFLSPNELAQNAVEVIKKKTIHRGG